MKKLYVPWRSAYTKQTAHADPAKTSADDCVFCKQLAEDNDENYFILRRFKNFIIMLNLYPYNAGHLLLLPIEHVASLEDLTPEKRVEFITILNEALTIQKQQLENHGTNIGMNLGKAAGAGIPNHLHMHILPRWTGDTNFLPTLADTKTVSVDLREIYNKLKPAFEKIEL